MKLLNYNLSQCNYYKEQFRPIWQYFKPHRSYFSDFNLIENTAGKKSQ